MPVVETERHGQILVVRMNRPERLNALGHEMRTLLAEAWTGFRHDDGLEVAIFTGTGRGFCAGEDMQESLKDGAPGGRRADIEDPFMSGALEKPVIAAVNGFALGGGCELAMACHIRIASDAAKFGQPESKLGLLPGYGGSQRLPRLVGKGRANQLLLTGEIIDAAEAYRIGLVNKVVAGDQLMNEARAMMKTILANGPLAVALCIEAIDRGLQMPLEEGLVLEANHFGLLAATDDMREGTRAFMEKRAPSFKGK
jgi:enoyl-CoA hydratase